MNENVLNMKCLKNGQKKKEKRSFDIYIQAFKDWF